MKRLLALAVVVLLASGLPVLSYTAEQEACYEGTDANGVWDDSLVYFDGELPGCLDGIEYRHDVLNVDGISVSGPWLRWIEP